MACVAPEGQVCGAKLILLTDLTYVPCELCQFGSPTDGTALIFVFECLLYPA